MPGGPRLPRSEPVPLLTISAAAEAAGVNRRTLQRAIADGRLSVSRDAQGKRGVDPAELFRVFAAQNVAATAAATGPATATATPSPPPEPGKPATAARALTAVALDAMSAQLAAAAEREAWLRSLLAEERAARRDLEQRLLPAPRRTFAERLADTLAALRRAWRGES